MVQVTQLHVSVDAPSEDGLKRVSRPLFRDYWHRLQHSLAVLRAKRLTQRTVCRMTLLEEQNTDSESCEAYAELFRLAECDFIEVKDATLG